MSINRDDWLKAIASIEPELDQSAVTAMELAVMLGVKRTAAKDRARKLVAQGRATNTHKRITDAHGRTQVICAYKLLAATKGRNANGAHHARPRRRREP